MSMPRSICLRTTSATASRNRAAWAFSSMGLLGPHHVEQIAGPRQAADVGGENPVDAALHGSSRCVLFRIARLHDVAHHRFSLGRRLLVEFRIHPARDPFAREGRLEFPANGGILLVIRDGAAAFAQGDGAIVRELLAGTTGLARALVVGPVPGGDAQALLADSEMLVEPIAAHRRRRDQTDRLVVLAQHLVGLAVPPRRGAERSRPG